MAEILSLCAIFLACNILFVLIGYILIYIFLKIKSLSFYSLFIAHLIGMSTVVVLTSIIKSGGQTINFLFLVFLALTFLHPVISNSKHMLSKKAMSAIVVSGLLVFSYYILKFFNLDINSVGRIHLDFVLYSNLTEYIYTFGKENNYLNYIYPESLPLRPYHYFEIWLNVFVYGATQKFSINTLLFVTYPTLSFGALLGYAALIEYYSKKWVYYLLPFALIFVSGFSFEFYKGYYLLKEIPGLDRSSIHYYHLFAPHIFMIFSVNLYVRNKFKAFLNSLFILPLVHITFVITVPISVVLFLFYFLKSKRLVLKDLFLYLLGLSVLLVGIYLFYKINAVTSETEANSLIFGLSERFDTNYLIRALKIVFKSLFQLPLLYAPAIVLLLFFFSDKRLLLNFVRKHVGIISCILLIILSALLSCAVFHWMFNSFQFFVVPSSLILSTIISIGIIRIVISKSFIAFRPYKKALVFFLIFLLTFLPLIQSLESNEMIYNADFMTEIKEHFINNNINLIGGYINEDVSDFMFISKNPVYYIVGADFLEYVSRGTYPICLSTIYMRLPEIQPLRNYEKKLRDKQPIVMYFEEQNFDQYEKVDTSLVFKSFIIENNMDYLVVAPGSKLPDQLKGLVKEEIQDPKSKARFLVLEY